MSEVKLIEDEKRPATETDRKICGDINNFVCTEPEGHKGKHIASGLTYQIAEWESFDN